MNNKKLQLFHLLLSRVWSLERKYIFCSFFNPISPRCFEAPQSSWVLPPPPSIKSHRSMRLPWNLILTKIGLWSFRKHTLCFLQAWCHHFLSENQQFSGNIQHYFQIVYFEFQTELINTLIVNILKIDLILTKFGFIRVPNLERSSFIIKSQYMLHKNASPATSKRERSDSSMTYTCQLNLTLIDSDRKMTSTLFIWFNDGTASEGRTLLLFHFLKIYSSTTWMVFMKHEIAIKIVLTTISLIFY